LCNGDASGAADLTVSGGVAPYTFLWSNFQASEDISGLNGGLYYVIVTDANGCTHRDSALINEPAALVLTTSVTSISCFNSNDGAIDLTVTGGTSPYSYAWSNGATTQDLANLQNGTYVVTVTDANACSATTSVTIINPSVISANFITDDPSCFMATDGAIDLIPAGGTTPFTFAWSNGATSEDITGIGNGTYIVTITDSKGCTRIDSATLVEPQPLVTSGFIKNVSCFGAADGFIDITAYGGTLPYSFTWSSGPSTEDIGGLVGANYFVTVTDANGCQASTLYPVLEPQQLAVNVVGTNVTCFGANDAQVAAVPTGGTTPYSYLWNTFDIDSAVYGLGAGKYTVQVIDSNGCTTYDSLVITQPSEIVVTGVVTNALCFAASTGAVDITVTGGTPTYTFNWSNSATTEDITAVSANVYTVTVTDATSCAKVASFTVGEGAEIGLDIASLNPVCNGGNTGSATAIVNGGTAPYSYAWSTGATSISVGTLVAGTYDVTVTDNKGCTVTETAQITAPADLLVDATAQGSRCFNQASGIVTTAVTGGFPPYTYLLNGSGQNSGSFSGLLPGDYVIVVTDANGCQGTDTFRVTSAEEISVDLNVTQQVILTGMETQLVANSSSSTPIIAHYWSPDTVIVDCDSTQNCNAPFAKPRTTTTFTVTVMNSDSCTASDTVTVIVQNEISRFFPTAITPNGDGLNDRFEFDILGADHIEVTIFDRWGGKVYYNPSQPNGITGANGWDGTKDGKVLSTDTYVYTVNVTYFDNAPEVYTGTVTIMK
jgi:gliding motility-associated-like protein